MRLKSLKRYDVAFERYDDTPSNYQSVPELQCPRCDSLYLHQGRVTVFDREEGAELTPVTTVAGGLAATHLRPSSEVGNPSGRRHGLAIAFDCEGCGGDLELTLAQEKGVTEVVWRFAERTKR
jgi:hypothetical protein